MEQVIIAHPVDQVQMFEEMPGIFGPEYESVDLLRAEAEAFNLVRVERVDPIKIARFDAVDEPFAVESGDVRPPAGADEQGGPPCKKLKLKREKIYARKLASKIFMRFSCLNLF